MPRLAFNDLVCRYLGDHLPAKEVEENGSQFELLFQQRRKPLTETLAMANDPTLLDGQLRQPDYWPPTDTGTPFSAKTVVDCQPLQAVDGN
jgi:hypothetical protein